MNDSFAFVGLRSYKYRFVPLLHKDVTDKKIVEDVYSRWKTHLNLYVEHAQEQITFGASACAAEPDQVEVDEVIVRKEATDCSQIDWHE